MIISFQCEVIVKLNSAISLVNSKNLIFISLFCLCMYLLPCIANTGIVCFEKF